MDKRTFLALLFSLIMILSGLSFLSQIKETNIPIIKNERYNPFTSNGETSNIDNFSCTDRSYNFANFTLQNLDYNISTTRGRTDSVINMANNFTGAYYIQNNGTLVSQNFISNNISYLAKSPLLYLKYDYLNYNGEYYGEMPYYNATNVLKWIFIYGTVPEHYFEIWGYNLVNSTVFNYTETNLTMDSSCNSNFQLSYVGNGNFIGIGSGESNYYVWNIYKKALVYSMKDPFYIVEANNIYYIPQYKELLDVWADGTSNDSLQYASISSDGEILNVINIATNKTYKINGVFDIIVDVSTNDVWINDGAGNYGLIIILHWDYNSFKLISANYTSSDVVDGIYNDYALQNNYIPIVTGTGCIQSGSGGYGSPAQFFINEFDKTSINITGLSGNDIKWATSGTSGDGAPIGIQLPEINNSYLNSSYYGMWLNTSSSVPHVFYVWNSTRPESLESYINKFEPLSFNLEIQENGLPSGFQWSYTFNGRSYVLTNTSYNYTLHNGNYPLNVDNITGFNLSYPDIINLDNENKIVKIEFFKPYFSVAFREDGLTVGFWGVNLNGTIMYTIYNNLTFTVKNGSYKFNVIYSSLLYNSNVTKGYANVSGSGIDIHINFTFVAYKVTFSNLGPPDNYLWSVTINGTIYLSNQHENNTITFWGRSGSYEATVSNSSGYDPLEQVFNFTISGNESIVIDYFINLSIEADGYNGFWEATVNGKEYSSNTNMINAMIKPGSTNISIANVNGYKINPRIMTEIFNTSQLIIVTFTANKPISENLFLSLPFLYLYIVLDSLLWIILIIYWYSKKTK